MSFADHIRSALRTAAALALAVGVAACGDSNDPAGPDGDLSQTEAGVMMEALVQAGGSFFLAPTVGLSAPAATPFSESFDESVSCPAGGSIAISGTVSGNLDDESGTGTVSMSVSQVHDACRATAESDGSTWTFDGAPSMATAFDWVVGENTLEMDGTQNGSIAWASGSRSGTCQVSLTYAFEVDPNAERFEASVQGSVCGFDVSDDIPVF